MTQPKLSRLQRRILEIALRNAQEENPTSIRQILGIVLGVEDVADPLVAERGGVFSKEHKGYRSALASISRALRRLESRGLIYRHGVRRGCTVFCLTAHGVEVAQGLTVSISARPADGGKKKPKRKPKPLSIEQPSFLTPKRLTQDDLEAAKDVEWRLIP